ncbi:UDP-N-acetylmuramoylalanyl-D-glutamyl-2,6-diaminopimelate--D-alanyl-D-alanine ligase [Aliihoeflea aestuarii]|jgi:UDP-N-acetylmuramoyl-tripeptide--D-alanyl-D-alanine ligase|uniref:UDP-N-acetylmuramoylalanyl-D-glutamyl-2, 6-diaminopimelate--D-alanyl-D-alanine ligase n=1 Tax=Aliihoeflea aestuarii TaxID=453840 RepID=UPI0020962AB5|nr:UDP-N-acetylmuramoylalanyl-D-glutamyl-2,6-diaminopimelate--D-alanyl-D-alanine ligase [Aliihoeflea aestuarii]MCO6392243.1 UDP-N-acetylmuramoylalanyl-D-glutamyl-2,6-diaminopimelate--D-alanyl-D-alanine ligase [Aliihoeflea aestuarii]
MSPLWTGTDLVAAMAGRPVGSMPQGITGISIDSRTLRPGEAFFAIKGDQFDGHDFATAAIKAGASLLVVQENKLPALGRLNTPMIVVPDVLEALVATGIAARTRSKAKIIAVTGSAGKTSTKEGLRTALSAVGTVHASDKSFNNHWGVPLTLARMPAETDYAVFEIGMNHPGEIRPLVKMVRPHIAIVTMIAAAHLGFFKDVEEIATAKAEIFESVEPGGHALLNRDDAHFKQLEKAARDAGVDNVWGFGEHSRATFKLVKTKMFADGAAFTAKMAGEDLVAKIRAPGRHMVQNAIAVLAASYLAGADMARVSHALADMRPEEGRGARHRLQHSQGAFVLIDESYNANPASIRAAMDVLQATDVNGHGRRIAVLGDMLELGVHSQALHAELAETIDPAATGVVLLVGPEMKALAEALPDTMRVEHRETVGELQPVLTGLVRAGDVVMIKASKSIGASRLVTALRDMFPAAETNPQRETAQDA